MKFVIVQKKLHANKTNWSNKRKYILEAKTMQQEKKVSRLLSVIICFLLVKAITEKRNNFCFW
jgi:hypothetical protein